MCSYCGCQSITLIGRFTEEHVDIINASGDLRRACEAGDLPEVRRTALVLKGLLFPHAEAEEKGIFHILAREEEFAEHIQTLCTEHGTLDAQLLALADGDLGQLDQFIEDLRAHIDKEENGLFPAAAVQLTGADWEEAAELTPAPQAAER
ncbi:MAG: hemerythrin domain-containing protein [Micrococcales bacterium]|nr:hemerythrin domain-containing protein [Micrococcales bacterium]